MREHLKAQRPGVTLIELIVGLVVLALIASIASAGGSLIVTPVEGDPVIAAIESALRASLRTGKAMPVEVPFEGGMKRVLVLPDGRVVGGESFGYDITGGRNSADDLPESDAVAGRGRVVP